MSKKTYLLLALLCASLVLFVAPAFAATQVVKSWDFSTNPGWTLDGDWAYGVPLGDGGDPVTGLGKDPTGAQVVPNTGGNVLGTNLAGNYSADASEFAVSDAVDCTGKVGTTLAFSYWLNVQSNNFDQATVEVSNGGDWVVVWENPGEADLIMAAFATKTVDISAVADGESAVQVRFGLVSDSSVEFGGWNVSAVEIDAVADNEFSTWLKSSGDDITGFWDLEDAGTGLGNVTGWQVGTPAAAASNNSGQPLTSAYASRVGVDPDVAANPDTGGLVLGYVVNGNYQRNMPARYATMPTEDFSASRAVKLTFARWLAVEDAASDHASIQINNNEQSLEDIFASDFSEDTIGDFTVTGNGTAVVNTGDEVIDLDGPVSVAIGIDTSDQYTIDGSADLATKFTTGGATLKLQWTDGDTNTSGQLIWNDLVTLTGKHSMNTYDFTIPRQNLGTDPKGEDNAAFQLRVVTTGALIGTDTAQIGSIFLEGVKWAYVWQNEATVPPSNLFDTEWTDESYDLSGDADGEEFVTVRFAMGPTDNFTPLAGQQATEFGGWSLDEIAFTEGTLAWKSVEDTYSFPTALFWGQDDESVTMTLKNAGTGYWDDSFFVAEVAGPADEAGVGTTPDGYPDPILLANSPIAVTPALIERYDVGSVSLEDKVDSGATVDISADLVAPPVSTIAYLTPDDDGTPTSPGDAATSVTGVNWFFFDMDENPVALYVDGDEADEGPDVPKGLVQISRFPDVQLNADKDKAYWARYWIEQLAGRVPLVVQGLTPKDAEGNPLPAIYLPEDLVSRGSLAVYITRAKGLPVSDPPGFVFKDVPVAGFGNPPATKTYWAAAQIEAVWKAGIVQGIPPDFTTFAPDNPVDRQGMAKFVAIGADLPGHDLTADVVKAQWLAYKADKDELPFADVALDVPGTTAGTSVPNPFLPFINACWKANVVQGITQPPGGSYAPKDNVTRSQLAVFVWRAFMRGVSTPVVLAGPAITGAALSPEVDATTPARVAFPTWIGYPQVSVADGWDNSNIAYVALDAMRLGAAAPAVTNAFKVTLELRDAKTPTVPAPGARTFNFPLSNAQIAGFATDALDTGNPYLTFYQLIPAATSTISAALADPMHGDFVLVASVTVPTGSPATMRTVEVARKPAYRSFGRFFLDGFVGETIIVPVSNGVGGWKVLGLPATSIEVVGGVSSDDLADVAKLVQTQEMRRHISTAGWKNVTLSFLIGASNLSASDTFAVEYSTDGGTIWNSVDGGSLSDVSDEKPEDVEMSKVKFPLPAAAAQNPNFWIRVKMTGASIDNIGYIDNIQLKGT